MEDEASLDVVGIGSMVKLLDLDLDEELDCKIVGSTEADSLEGKISNESPLGQKLLGKKVGEVVSVETQVGELQYKVLGITRDRDNE